MVITVVTAASFVAASAYFCYGTDRTCLLFVKPLALSISSRSVLRYT